jgi:site-specific DNA recombinase
VGDSRDCDDERWGAIYCRTPHPDDRLGMGLAEQERWCRQEAERAGVAVPAGHVFVDELRLAWRGQRAARSGWRALLAATRSDQINDIFLYLPTLLRHAPCDLAELLKAADGRGVRLYGEVGGDLADSVARSRILPLARLDCRRRYAVGRRAQEAHEAAAKAGRPHGGGRRPYGYTLGGARLVDDEAVVVREIYARFLAGESLRGIALSLNQRGVPTSYGGAWSATRVVRIVDSPRYAGIRTFRGDLAKADDGQWQVGSWPPCVNVDDWEASQRVREQRLAAQTVARKKPRRYLLTGLLLCDACDRHMVGSMVGTYPTYACTANSLLTRNRCSRHVSAHRLEEYVEQRAIHRLAEIINDGRGPAPGRHSAQALALLRASPDHAATWRRLTMTRKAAVLGWLFQTIRVGPKTTPRSVFDYGRIHFGQPQTSPANRTTAGW